jgi:hypothetical protein
MTIAVSGSNITFNDNSVQNTAATGFGFKNRILNGSMVLDQRNNGTSITVANASTPYTLDRWRAVRFNDGTGTFTVARSSTAPAGFINSALVTTSAAQASVPSNGLYRFEQAVEGFNVADLGWGAAGAQTITIGFWAKSSLTGTFGGRVANNDENRSYIIQYTINAANTWEFKTVTISGDTTGTWLKDNGIGLWLVFDLGSGTDFEGTANAWNASNVIRASGNVRLINTLNANLSITGVQLEKGSTATSFDYRPYGTELDLAQRYYVGANGVSYFTVGYDASYTTFNSGGLSWSYQMRTTPTIVIGGGGMDGHHAVAPTVRTGPTYYGVALQFSGSGLRTNANGSAYVTYALSAEL